MDWLSDLVKEYGIFAGLVVFFIWTGYLREKRLIVRIDDLEKFVQEKLTGMLEASAVALKQSSEALKENAKHFTFLCRVLENRPCLRNEDLVNDDD